MLHTVDLLEAYGFFFFPLLLSAVPVFTLAHRNCSLVSMTFVSTLPSVDTRKHCTVLWLLET